MNSPATLRDLFRALDFERPLDADDPADRALYVEGMHTSEGISPIDELRVNLEIADRPGTWLFTGHRGVGKSTELRRMAHELREKGFFVVVADVGEYLNLAEPVKIETLLLAAVASLADGADKLLGGSRLEASYAQRLWGWLTSTEVTLTQINTKLGETGFTAQLKENPDFRLKVQQALEASPGTWFKNVKAFVAQLVDDVRKQRGEQAQVVLILDSLERLRVTGADAGVCYDAIQRTFDVNGQYLKLEHLHVVYSVPPYLPFLSPRIGAYSGVEICKLPHVKVFVTPDFDRGTQAAQAHAPGIALLVQSVRRRYAQVEQVLPLAVLERLALVSSGSVRDFFRLVRSVCTKALASNAALPVNDARWPAMAEATLRAEMPLADEDLARLARVRETHGIALDKMENLDKVARLFDGGLVLNYRNGRDWCDVHFVLHADLPGPAALAAAFPAVVPAPGDAGAAGT